MGHPYRTHEPWYESLGMYGLANNVAPAYTHLPLYTLGGQAYPDAGLRQAQGEHQQHECECTGRTSSDGLSSHGTSSDPGTASSHRSLQMQSTTVTTGPTSLEPSTRNLPSASKMLRTTSDPGTGEGNGCRGVPILRLLRSQSNTSAPGRPVYTCNYESCSANFTCEPSLKRHKENIHDESDLLYICNECDAFDTARHDTMVKHSSKRGHTFSHWRRIAGNGSNHAADPNVLHRCSTDKFHSHEVRQVVLHCILKEGEHVFALWLPADDE